MDEIPFQKKASLTHRFTIAIDNELKKELMELKYQYGVDISEWIRNLIHVELPKARDYCEKRA